MDRRRAIGLAGAIGSSLLAGCWELLDGEGTPTAGARQSPTDAPTPTDTATPTEPAAGPTAEPPDDLPPGIGPDRVESAWELLRTHRSLLLERGFTVEMVKSWLGYSEAGELEFAGHLTEIAEVGGESSARGRYRRSDPPEPANGWRPFEVDTDWYFDGDTAYFRYHAEDGIETERIAVRDPPDRRQSLYVMPDRFVVRSYLESELTGASVVAIDRDEAGSLRRVLVERAVDPDEFTPSRRPTVIEIRATIDPEGIVREARSVSIRAPEERAALERRIGQIRFHAIGETEVGVPTWVWHL